MKKNMAANFLATKIEKRVYEVSVTHSTIIIPFLIFVFFCFFFWLSPVAPRDGLRSFPFRSLFRCFPLRLCAEGGPHLRSLRPQAHL